MEALSALLLWCRDRFAAIRTRDGERGQGMVEYALILMLMAIVVLVLLSVVGRQTSNVFSNVSSGLAQ